jgi:hypothetical protein
MDGDCLQAMYEFEHSGPSTKQGEGHARALCQLVRTFAESHQGGKHAIYQWAAGCLLGEAHAPFEIRWFGEYGCAMFMTEAPSGCTLASSLTHIDLVCLDAWRFSLHADPEERRFRSLCGGTSVVRAGQCSSGAEFVATFERLLAKAQQRHGDKRSAATNAQGHQKTPSFIWAVIQDAFFSVEHGTEAEQWKTKPPGGFTDVGQHTGGQPRSTTWPLVEGILLFALDQHGATAPGGGNMDWREPHTFLQFMLAELHLWVAERQLVDATSAGTGLRRRLEVEVMTVLRHATRMLAKLADEGRDISGYEERCATLRRVIEGQAGAAHEHTGAHRLPGLAPEKIKLRDMRLDIPVGGAGGEDGQRHDLTKARDLASQNLGRLLVHDPERCSVAEASKTLAEAAAGTEDTRRLQLALHTADTVLYRHARTLSDASSGIAAFMRADFSDPSKWITLLDQCLDQYREALAKLQALVAGRGGRQMSELRSRELLAGFITYCLVHQATAGVHPLVNEYGVALRWQDLRHLVLPDLPAWEAVAAVVEYLRRYDGKTSKPLFSLRQPRATFAFAEVFGPGDHKMKGRWALEVADAAQRKEDHWQKVLDKKERARELEAELSSLRSKEAEKRVGLSDLRSQKPAWCSSCERHRGRLWRSCSTCSTLESRISTTDSAIRQLEVSIESKESELKVVKVAPPPVFQPLPESQPLAMRVLFFMLMPTELKTLARLSFSVQQLLLPRAAGSFTAPEVVKAVGLTLQPSSIVAALVPSTVLEQYYGQRSNHSSSCPRVVLGSLGGVPKPSDVGPRNIDQIWQPEQGIWHPDTLCSDKSLIMSWSGGGFSLDTTLASINPFAIDPYGAIVSWDFMEALPPGCESLQYTLWQPGRSLVDRARSNRPIAQQEGMPRWVTEPGFLAFASLRAYPRLQTRKLCTALHDRTLPLKHRATHALVKQALFHIGELAAPDGQQGSHFAWKADMFGAEGGWLEVLETEIAELVGEHEHAPREGEALRLLGELAAFVAQWRPGAADVARRVTEAAQAFVDTLEKEVEALEQQESQQHARVETLRAKQSVLVMTALLCYGNEWQLREKEAADMVRLSMIIGNLSVYGADTVYEAEIAELTVACQHVMAARIVTVEKAIGKGRRGDILTQAARAVYEGAAENLRWTSLGDGCYEAVDPVGGDLISMNILSGVFLLNGVPLRRLPASITGHPLYKRTFGDRGFETGVSAGGAVFKTARAVRGRFYEFVLSSADGASGVLTIREVDAESGVALQLLDGTSTTADWQGDLPIRLRGMHSHWWWAEERVLVLRGIRFLERGIAFILKPSPESATFQCFRVPDHLRKEEDLSKLLKNLATDEKHSDLGLCCDRLVHLEEPRQLVAVLREFEDPAVIEVYKEAASGALKVIFPRFGLGFRLQKEGRLREEWRLASLELRGFVLPRQQKLLDTLYGFDGYLVLQREGPHASDTKLLIPRGKVHGQAPDWAVRVEASPAFDAKRQYETYDVHPRFKSLTAASVAARLHLACLFAASGTLLPDPRHGMTGHQVAVELVRWSWVNRPLSADEAASLKGIKSFTQTCAGLALLAYELEGSSKQLHFLHNPGSDQMPRQPRLDPKVVVDYDNEPSPRNLRHALTPRRRRVCCTSDGRASHAAARCVTSGLLTSVPAPSTPPTSPASRLSFGSS